MHFYFENWNFVQLSNAFKCSKIICDNRIKNELFLSENCFEMITKCTIIVIFIKESGNFFSLGIDALKALILITKVQMSFKIFKKCNKVLKLVRKCD